MSAIIHIKRLNICHDNQFVLKNINCSIARGEFVFLIGKTGSGKSSLLKTLYGEIPCRFGKVQIADFALHNMLPKQLPFLRRKLGIIFQDFQLLLDRNVEENLRFVLRATGWDKKTAIQQRIEEVLMKVGLTGTNQKMPYQLSGGEQQRVAIARSLLNDPVVLLADEPTGNLDPIVAHEILSLFLNINKSGTAVIMATHNYDFLNKNYGRVLKCQDGLLVETSVINNSNL